MGQYIIIGCVVALSVVIVIAVTLYFLTYNEIYNHAGWMG